MNHYYALLMAGGGGTRLWPLSREQMPKQMLSLVDQQTLFRNTVERLLPLLAPENIYISTSIKYLNTLRADAPEIPISNFIVEPDSKNSGPAAALGMRFLYQRDPQAIVAMLATDHYIARAEKFRKTLKAAFKIAQQEHIVTLGISPTYPATGYGYIQQGEPLGSVDNMVYFQSQRFTEKPDVVLATKFVTSGQYSWNSGMFIWKARIALQEFERQQPDIHSLIDQLDTRLDTPEYQRALSRIWKKMPSISIDFALMEGAKNIVVIPADIGWSDVGSWSTLFDVLPQDQLGNCNRGGKENHRIQLNTKKTLVISDRLTVTIGVENLIIIDSQDALLICNKENAQDVKQVVNYLRDNGFKEYL